MHTLIKQRIEQSISVKNRLLESIAPIIDSAHIINDALKGGHKILVCGNGGSAADAQHFSAELVNRFQTERRALPAIALTTDSSIVTSVANDYSYHHIFARQVEAIGLPGDILLGISTSGLSANILSAFSIANSIGVKCILLTGNAEPSSSPEHKAHIIPVPSDITARIQESHILILHILCELIDNEFN
ncbi:MAG: D-sedoheptulose-7-phosphate isomerase [bacterium]